MTGVGRRATGVAGSRWSAGTHGTCCAGIGGRMDELGRLSVAYHLPLLLGQQHNTLASTCDNHT